MYALQYILNGQFVCYLVGKKKSYSKRRKFDNIESTNLDKAMMFNTLEEADIYRRLSPLTLHFQAFKIN